MMICIIRQYKLFNRQATTGSVANHRAGLFNGNIGFLYDFCIDVMKYFSFEAFHLVDYFIHIIKSNLIDSMSRYVSILWYKMNDTMIEHLSYPYLPPLMWSIFRGLNYPVYYKKKSKIKKTQFSISRSLFFSLSYTSISYWDPLWGPTPRLGSTGLRHWPCNYNIISCQLCTAYYLIEAKNTFKSTSTAACESYCFSCIVW